MIDIASVAVGLVCGGGIGFIAGRLATAREVKQYRDDIFVRDQLIDAAQRKLEKLTKRDPRGRFTGGKK
jgi:membrane protein DedA with SNARE-associated domain